MFRDVLAETSPGSPAESGPSESDTPSPGAEVRCLMAMERGQRVRLVTESLPSTHRPLLEAMGLCNDCDLHICLSSGTCIIDIDGSRLGISRQVARSIMAIPVGP
ncbi:MAG: hypothetical protein DSY81_07715 [Bacillota bacterium]|nr:MAG: hypothetical protein DSY92_03930 [Planctomycetota bacterium]RUA08987.1 MAG: hypothetical protein DSY81_07715 [Bacillota bacterium]